MSWSDCHNACQHLGKNKSYNNNRSAVAVWLMNGGERRLIVDSEQGTFEADEDRVVRIKLYQFYGFGQFPKAVVFDKIDIVGNTIHPFYRCASGDGNGVKL